MNVILHEEFLYFQKIGEKVTEDQLHDILSEVDLNRNAQVDLGEFLQVSCVGLCSICPASCVSVVLTILVIQECFFPV